jgi:hypothetical protein
MKPQTHILSQYQVQYNDASFGTNRNQSVPKEENNIGLDDINPEERIEKLVS